MSRRPRIRDRVNALVSQGAGVVDKHNLIADRLLELLEDLEEGGVKIGLEIHGVTIPCKLTLEANDDG